MRARAFLCLCAGLLVCALGYQALARRAGASGDQLVDVIYHNNPPGPAPSGRYAVTTSGALYYRGSTAWTIVANVPTGHTPCALFDTGTPDIACTDGAIYSFSWVSGTATLNPWDNVFGGSVTVDPSQHPGVGFSSDPLPNPTRGAVTFGIALLAGGRVRARVFDVRGRLVAVALDRDLATGTHSAAWDGRTLHGSVAPPGVYFLRLEVPGAAQVRRIVLR